MTASMRQDTTTTLPSDTAHAPESREPSAPPRFLSKPAYAALLKQIRSFASARGTTDIRLDSNWRSDVQWARNRVTMSGDWRDIEVDVHRRDFVTSNQSGAYTNQLDAGSLHGAVVWCETMGQRFFGDWPERADTNDVPPPDSPPFVYPDTHIWSDVSYRQSYKDRVTIANQLVAGAEAAGMLSAGYLAVEAGGAMLELPNKYVLYAPHTEAQLSMTVRDPEWSGSGWAGVPSYDWSRIDAAKFAAIALDKCLKSRHPLRIEPGRYTVIMEPQATYALLEPLHWYDTPHAFLDLGKNLGNPEWPFALPLRKRVTVSKYGDSVTLGSTRLGQRVFDTRLNMYFNPTNPELGLLPWWTNQGDPMQPVQWIRNGILENLSYPPHVGTGGLGDLYKDGHPVTVSVSLRDHDHQAEDYDFIGHWLMTSWTPGTPATPSAPGAAPAATLTIDALNKLTAFWTSFAKEPDSIRVTARRRYLHEMVIPVGQEQPVSWLTDMPAFEAKYRVPHGPPRGDESTGGGRQRGLVKSGLEQGGYAGALAYTGPD